MPDQEPLDRLIIEVEELKERFTSHESRHIADQRLLASIVDSLATHQTNHHSRATTVRQTISIGAVLAILAAIAEVVRQFAL